MYLADRYPGPQAGTEGQLLQLVQHLDWSVSMSGEGVRYHQAGQPSDYFQNHALRAGPALGRLPTGPLLFQ